MLSPDQNAPILSVDDLRICFKGKSGPIHAVRGVSLQIRKGEVVGLVGESGCGKSVTALAVMQLLASGDIRSATGSIRFMGEDILNAGSRKMRDIRGDRIGMIFQDPMTSLNPTHTIGYQIAESVRVHRSWSSDKAVSHARHMLDLVRIPAAVSRLGAYPHELSGGMRQRVMIAMALACDPELLIADEPTTALDVTVQAQILELIDDLRHELGMSVLLITHDLGVVAHMADRIAVMYAGQVIETGPVSEIFSRPQHGYTAGLLTALPGYGTAPGRPLKEIPGTVPNLDRDIAGCAFFPRCEFGIEKCREPLPPEEPAQNSHRSRCIRANEVLEAMRENRIVKAWA